MSKRAKEAAFRAYPPRSSVIEAGYLKDTDDIRKIYAKGYRKAKKDTIQRIREELERRLDLYGCLSKETIHPVRLDEERSMLRFLDELEKE